MSETPPENQTPSAGEEAVLDISDITTEGEGIARWPGGLVVFVANALPGDRVRARFQRLHGRIGRARALELVEGASARREVPCRYQERCGGCPLMPLDESAVLDVKARQVVETLRRVGGVEVELSARCTSPESLRYRNRARLGLEWAEGAFRLGYRPRGDAGELVAIDDCLLLPQGVVELAQAFLQRLARCNLGGAPPTHLSLRGSLHYDSWIIVLHGPPGRWEEAAQLAKDFVTRESRLTGIVRVLEKGPRRVATHVLAGRGLVIESMAGREVPLDATSFLQVNPRAADLLYREVKAALGASDEPARLLDLYCGVGLTGLAGSPPYVSIVGVEAHPRAARAAAELAAREGRHAEYISGDATRALSSLLAQGEHFDYLIANPPRAGADAGLASRVHGLGVRRVVLVSCHPATLARDLRAFGKMGYAVHYAAVVDLFPQTAEVETVLGLSL